MIIELNKLNPLEQQIYHNLTNYAKTNATLKIAEAARLCGCSPSKISKFAKKLGFGNFKQFVSFMQGKEPPVKEYSNELQRIRDFTETFNPNIVDSFISLLENHKKIIILGYGPSYYCAQYFEYKLRILYDAFIIAVPDLVTAQSLIDETTLLVIFTTTGHFTSFKEICENTKQKNGDTLLIVEEYHPDLLEDYDTIYFLTHQTQSPELAPYEKSRTIFMIFIEEVIFALLKKKKKPDEKNS